MAAVDFVLSWIKSETSQIYTTLPAKVTKVYKKDNSTVLNVQTLVNRVDSQFDSFLDAEMLDVPIQWPSAGGCYITCPIEVGDQVTLHFYMRNAAGWKRSDGVEPQTPTSVRSHSKNDVFAVPSVQPFTEGREVDSEALAMGSEGIEIRVLKSGAIQLGSGATEALVLGDKFKTYLDGIVAKLESHIHPVTTLVDGTPTAGVMQPSPTLEALPKMPDSTLSEKVTTL